MARIRVRPLHYLLIGICSLLCVADCVNGQCQYEVTAIIEPPPVPEPFIERGLVAQAINNHGHVTGWYKDGVTLDDYGFLWTPEDGLTTLQHPPGVTQMWPNDINDHGVIVGTWSNTNVPGSRRGFVYWPDTQTYTELDTQSGAGWGMAHAINNSNVVVGERSNEKGVTPRNAFIWSTNDGFNDLGLLNESISAATSINDLGVVAGVDGFATSVEAFIYDGSITSLDVIPNTNSSTAMGISDRGEVGSSSYTPSRAAIWTGSSWQVIPFPDGCLTGGAANLNARGVLLAGCRDHEDDWNPFIAFPDGSMRPLADLIVDPSAIPRTPFAIGDGGQILVELEGQPGVALLTPVNAPTADLTGDCRVDARDLRALIELWGTQSTIADITRDDRVNVFDLLALLHSWTG